MDLSSLLGNMPPEIQIMKAIEQNKVDDIKDEDLEQFAVRLLVPIRGRLDDIMAKPGNKNLLLNKPQFLTAEELAGLDLSKLGQDEKVRLMAQAMMMHTGWTETYSGTLHVADRVTRYYNGSPDLTRSTIAEYFNTPMWKRAQSWLADAIGVGIFRQEGERKLRLLPFNEAAENARQFILNRKEKDSFQNIDGMDFEITDQQLADEKKDAC